jgi:hypothetical protein
MSTDLSRIDLQMAHLRDMPPHLQEVLIREWASPLAKKLFTVGDQRAIADYLGIARELTHCRMKIETRTFTYQDKFGGGVVEEGERVADGHELIAQYPSCWRDFGLDDELKVRSDRIAELPEAAERPAGRTPVSRAAREERKQEDFWRATEKLLDRTRDDLPTAAERKEQAFYDRALAEIEESDAQEIAQVNDEAVRDSAFDRGWSRRVSD